MANDFFYERNSVRRARTGAICIKPTFFQLFKANLKSRRERFMRKEGFATHMPPMRNITIDLFMKKKYFKLKLINI